MTKKKLTSKAFRFSDDELALLDELKGPNGTYKGTVMRSLRLLKGQNQPSNDELLQMLKDRLE